MHSKSNGRLLPALILVVAGGPQAAPAADSPEAVRQRIAPVAGFEFAAGSGPQASTPAPAAAPAASPAAAAPPPAAAEADVRKLVEQWAKRWSARDIDGYLAFYGKDFAPENGNRADWEKSRRQKIAGKKSIRVTIRDLALSTDGEKRYKATFLQDYSADGFSEKGSAKTLTLAREGSDWRIIAERSGR